MQEMINSNQLSDWSNFELVQRFFEMEQPGEAEELATEFFTAFPTLTDYKVSEWGKLQDLWQSRNGQFQSLMIALKLGQNIANAPRPYLGQVFSSKQLGETLVEQFQNDAQENLCLICLNVKHQIISHQIVFRGSIATCPAHPREIFSIAIQKQAQCIVLAHNHPSGSPQPSENDIEFSNRMVQCGALMGIKLLDSFIIGRNDYLSMREDDMLDS